ncbi:hypothetical protein L484_000074 [Morus notabilis]|uniref:Uncharacterized protein n=1 Tax=Morus notabilis TaxID=981085 RepID=W9SPU0_9ROSA|nr:hypothetical protein L484_000074 [Morus notabilis]
MVSSIHVLPMAVKKTRYQLLEFTNKTNLADGKLALVSSMSVMLHGEGNLTRDSGVIDVKVLSSSIWQADENNAMKLRDQQGTALQHWLLCNVKI